LLTLACDCKNGIFTVDLEAQIIHAPDGSRVHFEVDVIRKAALVLGQDEIAQTLVCAEFIEAYERSTRLPILVPAPAVSGLTDH
jgi:3-isopropylmalate/(R)-2-methylmalate dehydratase small subunit